MTVKKKRQLQIWNGIGHLLTMKGAAEKKGCHVQEEDLSCIKNAAIAIGDGQIEWVGPQSRLPKAYAKEKNVKEKNFDGRTLLPAFVESHTHLVFAGDRSDEFEMRNRGVSYQEIANRGGGILSTVKKTRRASLDDLIVKSQRAVDDFVRQGVTTLEVKSGYALNKSGEIKMLEVARALKKARIVPTFLGAHSVPPEFETAESYMDHLLDKIFPAIEKRNLACRGDIFVEQGYFDLEQARRYLHRAKEMGWDTTVHADQLSRTGATLLALEYGARSVDHVNELSDKDIVKISESETTCVLLPGADFYIGCPYPRARELIDTGARVALATDYNPGSSPTQDLALIGVLARLEMKMTLPEILAAYTLNGAYALGLEGQLGSVEIGREADLVALEGDWTELFYRVGQMPVTSVYKSGKKTFAV